MSSPTRRRTALAGKSTNIRASTVHKTTQYNCSLSPSKCSQVDLNYALRHSPVRNVPLTSLEKNSSPALPFIILEETAEERTVTLMNHMVLSKASKSCEDENDFSSVKENMSPSKLNQKTISVSSKRHPSQTLTRRPLRDLSISEHKGYVENPPTRDILQLTLQYNKKSRLPSFVTPPRDVKLRQYFSTTGHGTDYSRLFTSRSTDDIPKDKVVRKLEFKICEN